MSRVRIGLIFLLLPFCASFKIPPCTPDDIFWEHHLRLHNHTRVARAKKRSRAFCLCDPKYSRILWVLQLQLLLVLCNMREFAMSQLMSWKSWVLRAQKCPLSTPHHTCQSPLSLSCAAAAHIASILLQYSTGASLLNGLTSVFCICDVLSCLVPTCVVHDLCMCSIVPNVTAPQSRLCTLTILHKHAQVVLYTNFLGQQWWILKMKFCFSLWNMVSLKYGMAPHDFNRICL